MFSKKSILVAGIALVISSASFADEILFADGKAGDGVKISRKLVPAPDKSKNKVIDYTVAARGGSINVSLKKHDWSSYTTLRIKFYAKEKTDTKLIVVLGSQPKNLDKKKGWSYLYKKIVIKGQGWKTINIDLAKMGKARKAVGLKQIDNLGINSRGWNIKPVKTAKLYIGEIKLISK